MDYTLYIYHLKCCLLALSVHERHDRYPALRSRPFVYLKYWAQKSTQQNMDVRSNESPMDFQWQQGYGPAGADSPFMKAMSNNPQRQETFGGQKRLSSSPFYKL